MPVTFEMSGDWEGFDRAIAAIEGFAGATVATGVRDEEHEGPRAAKKDPPHTTASLMMINEFGDADRNIPARPIFTPAMDENKDKYLDMVEAAFASYRRKGGSEAALRSALQVVAEMMVQDVKAVQRSQVFGEAGSVPLHPRTIERKDHDIAWKETGQLLKALEGFVDVDFKPQRGKSGTAFLKDKLGRFAKVGG